MAYPLVETPGRTMIGGRSVHCARFSESAFPAARYDLADRARTFPVSSDSDTSPRSGWIRTEERVYWALIQIPTPVAHPSRAWWGYGGIHGVLPPMLAHLCRHFNNNQMPYTLVPSGPEITWGAWSARFFTTDLADRRSYPPAPSIWGRSRRTG